MRRRSGGYALFEALIAVVVLSVGFIGAARMQTVGLKLNNSAHSRQKAALLAYQMTDRIRANPGGTYAGASAGATDCVDNVGGCTPTEMAAADLTLWRADLAAQLPSGFGVVCLDSSPNDGSASDALCDGAAGSAVVVKVFWADTVAAEGSVFASPVRR